MLSLNICSYNEKKNVQSLIRKKLSKLEIRLRIAYPSLIDFLVSRFFRLLFAGTSDSFQPPASYCSIMTNLHVYWPFADFRESFGKRRISMAIHVAQQSGLKGRRRRYKRQTNCQQLPSSYKRFSFRIFGCLSTKLHIQLVPKSTFKRKQTTKFV